MTQVQTVLGPVDETDLGRVLVHEHIRISYAGDHLDPSYSWNRADCVATSVERMHQLQEHRVKTFVDPCPIELGRDPELMAEVAQQSGMHVVCSTGFYHEHDAIGHPYYWRVRSPEEVAEFLLHEIANGIGETGIKPGVIKIASGAPPTDSDRKFLHGAAIAAEESGLPVVSHCENSQGGDVQQDILAEHGVDLGHALIGHQDQAPSADQHLEIARRGSFVGIDRIGLFLAPDEHRADCIKAIVDAGLVGHVLLSQDHMCCLASPKFPYPIPPAMQEAFEQMLPTIYDQMYRRPHTYVFTDFLPLLRDRGIDDATIDAIFADNTRRFLTGAGPQ
jgi:phosphotriesterase-related protein